MNFEKATRMKLRFDSPKGGLSVEDLWDLPLTAANGKTSLNEVAKGVNRLLKESADEDFVNKASTGNEILALKMDIVKHVIAVRLAENEEALRLAEKREKKKKIMELIERKQDQQLEGMPLEELQAMVQGL